jgi:hypothetical protein
MIGVMALTLVACGETASSSAQAEAFAQRGEPCACQCSGVNGQGDLRWLRPEPGSRDTYGWLQGYGPDGTCESGSTGACSGYASDGLFNPNGTIENCTDDLRP